MLTLKRFRPGQLQIEPFSWAVVDDVFSNRTDGETLRREFPVVGLAPIASSRPDKQYAAQGASIGDTLLTFMTPMWRRLIEVLNGEAYGRAVESLTGLPLLHLKRELTLWRYCAGDYLGPHVDKPQKIVTQIFYFSSPDWVVEDGGCLEILSGNDPSAVVVRLEPRLGRVVTLVRSERSWHAVSPPRHPVEPRLSLQLVFTREAVHYSHDV